MHASALTKPFAPFIRPSGSSLSIDESPAVYQQLMSTIRSGPRSVYEDRRAYDQIQSLLAAVCGLSFKSPETYGTARSILANLPDLGVAAKETLDAVLGPFVRPATAAERGDAASSLAAELRAIQPNEIARQLGRGSASSVSRTKKVELGRHPLMTRFNDAEVRATWQQLASVAPDKLAREALQLLAGTTIASKLLVLDWLRHEKPELPVEAFANSKEFVRLALKDYEAERVRSPDYERNVKERAEAQNDPGLRSHRSPPPKPGSFEERREKFADFTLTLEMGIHRMIRKKVVPQAIVDRAIEDSVKDITELLAASRKEALRPLDVEFLWGDINRRAAEVKLLGGDKAIAALGLERELEQDCSQLSVKDRASTLSALLRKQQDRYGGGWGVDLHALRAKAERSRLERDLQGAKTAPEKARLVAGWLQESSKVDFEVSRAMDELRSQLVESLHDQKLDGLSKDELLERWHALDILGGVYEHALERDLYAIGQTQPGLVPHAALDGYFTLSGRDIDNLVYSALQLKPPSRPSLDPAAVAPKDVKAALVHLIAEGEDRADNVRERVRQILGGLSPARKEDLAVLEEIHSKTGDARTGRVSQHDVDKTLEALHPGAEVSGLRRRGERLADALNVAMQQIWPTMGPEQQLLAARPEDVRPSESYFRNRGRSMAELRAALDGTPAAALGLTLDVLVSMPEYAELARRFLSETGATSRTFRAGSRDLVVDSSQPNAVKIGFRGVSRVVDVGGPVRDVIAIQNPKYDPTDYRGHSVIVMTDRDVLRINLDEAYDGLRGGMPPWNTESLGKLPRGVTVAAVTSNAIKLSNGSKIALPGAPDVPCALDPLYPPETGTSREERAALPRPWQPAPEAPKPKKGVFPGQMATGTRTRTVIDRDPPASIQFFPGGESFYRPTGWASWWSQEVRPGLEGNRLVLWDVAGAERQEVVDLKALAEHSKFEWKTPAKLGEFVPFDSGYGSMVLMFQADDAIYALKLGSYPRFTKVASSKEPIEGWTVRQALKGPPYLDIELRHPGQEKPERVQVYEYDVNPRFRVEKWQASGVELGETHIKPPPGEEKMSRNDARRLPLLEQLEYFAAELPGLGPVQGGWLIQAGGATYLAKAGGTLQQIPDMSSVEAVIDGRYLRSSWSSPGGGLLDRMEHTKLYDLETGKSYSASQYVDSNGMGGVFPGPIHWDQAPPPAALQDPASLALEPNWRAQLVEGLSDAGRAALQSVVERVTRERR